MNIKTLSGGYDHNFTYVVDNGKECFVIDPALPFEEIIDYIKKQNLTLKFVIILHSHFDHIMDLDKYREKGFNLFGHESSPIFVHKKLKEKDEVGVAGAMFKVIHTPGHKFDAICLFDGTHLFTSDTLFVEGCGRVDLPGSDPTLMPATLEKLKSLPDDTIIYPGHDYGPTPTSTIGKEKKNNPYLNQSEKHLSRFIVSFH